MLGFHSLLASMCAHMYPLEADLLFYRNAIILLPKFNGAAPPKEEEQMALPFCRWQRSWRLWPSFPQEAQCETTDGRKLKTQPRWQRTDWRTGTPSTSLLPCSLCIQSAHLKRKLFLQKLQIMLWNGNSLTETHSAEHKLHNGAGFLILLSLPGVLGLVSPVWFIRHACIFLWWKTQDVV